MNGKPDGEPNSVVQSSFSQHLFTLYFSLVLLKIPIMSIKLHILLGISIYFIYFMQVSSQPPQGPMTAAGAGGGGPPPGRGFQLKCYEDYAYADIPDPDLIQEFSQNAPPDFQVVNVLPCIYPGKNAHRYLVMYHSTRSRRCEEIQEVWYRMNSYKPQIAVVGTIAVVPGGYLVEYSKFCRCLRKSSHRRRRRWGLFNVGIQSQNTSANETCNLNYKCK